MSDDFFTMKPSLQKSLANRQTHWVFWKILIVDDDEDIHVVTRLILDNFTFEDKSLQFLDAYSGKQAIGMLEQHPDVAMILLDVVMESEDAGLRTVKHIRQVHKNDHVRIVLRTGQPGQAPENDVIRNYDINDYKEKAELTSQKMFTTVLSALRSYRDIKSIEASRQALIQAQNQMITHEKMACLGQLSQGVAHEINNPNNFINGGLQNLTHLKDDLFQFLIELMGDNPDEDIVSMLRQRFEVMGEQLDLIRHGSRRIQNIVSDLSLATRNEVNDPFLVDILQGLVAVVSLTQTQFPDVEIKMDLCSAINKVCQPTELNLVYMALVLNACQAVVRARESEQRQEKGTVRIRARRNNDMAVLQFSDNGDGIPQELKTKIFEAFFTTQPVGAGSGLGLYSAWCIVRELSGTLAVDSTPAKGSTFTLELPL